jgi:hypothetical protein
VKDEFVERPPGVVLGGISILLGVVGLLFFIVGVFQAYSSGRSVSMTERKESAAVVIGSGLLVWLLRGTSCKLAHMSCQ